jgi:Arc/MetJ-type ribon-helix-helix transcriptional regulator
MKKLKTEKKKQTRQGQITMPPQYWRAIDEKVRKDPEKFPSRSAVIRLALDLMEW